MNDENKTTTLMKERNDAKIKVDSGNVVSNPFNIWNVTYL